LILDGRVSLGAPATTICCDKHRNLPFFHSASPIVAARWFGSAVFRCDAAKGALFQGRIGSAQRQWFELLVWERVQDIVFLGRSLASSQGHWHLLGAAHYASPGQALAAVTPSRESDSRRGHFACNLFTSRPIRLHHGTGFARKGLLRGHGRVDPMSRVTWPDFEDFQHALPGMQGGYLLRARPERNWQARTLRLPGVTLTLAREATGTIYVGKSDFETYHCVIPLSAHRSTLVDGIQLDRRSAVWLVPNETLHITRLVPSLWLDIAIDSKSIRPRIADHETLSAVNAVGHNRIVTDDELLPALLGFVHHAFLLESQLVSDMADEGIRRSVAAVAIDLVLVMLETALSEEMICKVAARRHHILETTLSLIDSCDAQLDTGAMCAFAYTTERTIRNVFNDYFHLSPHRYVMLRRLHSIRRCIRDPGCLDNITSICARHGVWDFGRLAAQYRGCFGVLPSEDRRARGESA
jgi:AraC family ethanolamine operon transcriptional activator